MFHGSAHVQAYQLYPFKKPHSHLLLDPSTIISPRKTTNDQNSQNISTDYTENVDIWIPEWILRANTLYNLLVIYFWNLLPFYASATREASAERESKWLGNGSLRCDTRASRLVLYWLIFRLLNGFAPGLVLKQRQKASEMANCIIWTYHVNTSYFKYFLYWWFSSMLHCLLAWTTSKIYQFCGSSETRSSGTNFKMLYFPNEVLNRYQHFHRD